MWEVKRELKVITVQGRTVCRTTVAVGRGAVAAMTAYAGGGIGRRTFIMSTKFGHSQNYSLRFE